MGKKKWQIKDNRQVANREKLHENNGNKSCYLWGQPTLENKKDNEEQRPLSHFVLYSVNV